MEDLRSYFESLLDEREHEPETDILERTKIWLTTFDLKRMIAACDLAIINKSDYKAQYDSRF